MAPISLDEKFSKWSKPASDTEEAKASHAADMIRSAVRAYVPFTGRNIEVYATGSYRNNTNVRSDSDIDIAVVCHDSIYYFLPNGLEPESVGLKPPASYGFENFREDLKNALFQKFGSSLKPSRKTFNVPENTYRIEADVTPFFEYRKYSGALDSNRQWFFEKGVKSVTTNGESFINWHEDHYREGVSRNDQTRRRFKRVVRILKNVKKDMAENGIPEANSSTKQVPSFLIECLVFNAPDSCFNLTPNGYVDDVRAVIRYLWAATKTDGNWKDLFEVSRRKKLFLEGQIWTPEVANSFLVNAWKHLGL